MEKQVPKDDKSSVALLEAKEQWSNIAKDVLPFSGPKSANWVKPKKVHGKYFLFFGVILPMLAMTLELWTHTLARYYFDPFPSVYHVVLFTLIPLSNLMAYLSGRMDLTRYYAPMALFSGMAMGIGVLYTLMFLSVTPTMCIAILAFGIGLLGLAPLLSLPCTWFAGKTVCAFAHRQRAYFDAHQVEHIGHLIVLVMVIAVELPSTLTRVHLGEATESDKSHEAVSWLRKYGNQEVMLRACYERSGRATDVLGTLYEHAHPITVEQAREIFYQVTGKAFNSVPIPASARSTIQKTGMVSDIAGVNATVEDEFDLDADIAGEAVSGIARGLSVKGSALVGTIDNDGAIAKMEWIMSLENSSKYDREARAKLLLPPGAVVTGAKIVINNIEREATIMTRSVAREIYRQNIIAKKDPLLVSMSGMDRVLIQCFPVRPMSKADVKLTIVAPISINGSGTGSLELPAFEERNFVLEGPVTLTFDSKAPIKCDAAAVKIDAAKPLIFNATIDGSQLSRFNGIVNVERDRQCHRTWCHDRFTGNAYVVERVLQPQTYPVPQSLYVVVDGSEAMQAYRQQIVDGLKTLNPGMKVQLQVVGDETRVLCRETSASSPEFNTALNALNASDFQGGQRDDLALKNCMEQSFKSNGAVLWIHACQPMSSVAGDVVKQYLKAESKTPRLYDLQVATGPNEILSGIDSNPSLIRVKHTGNLKQDLDTLFNETWKGQTSDALDQYLHHLGDGPSEPGHETISELAQLQGYEQILKENQAGNEQRAIHIAQQYHLVSPVSSAIVNVPLVDTNLIIEPPPPPNKASNPFENQEVMRGLEATGATIGYFITGQFLANAISSAFSATVSQLNNLSAAAGVAGGPAYTGGGSSGFGGSFGDAYSSQGDEGYNYNAKKDASQPVVIGAPAPASSPVPNSSTGLSFGDAYSSQGDTGIQQQNSNAPMQFAQELTKGLTARDSNLFAKESEKSSGTQQYKAGQYPQLQGATNGTVGPQGGNATVFQDGKLMDARSQVTTQGLVFEKQKARELGASDKSGLMTEDHEMKEESLGKEARKAESRRQSMWGGQPMRVEGSPGSISIETPAVETTKGPINFSFPGSQFFSGGRGVSSDSYYSEYSESNQSGRRSHGFLDGTSVAIKLLLVVIFACLYPFVLIFVKNRQKGNYKL